jgi:hypothetical protein
VKKTLFLQVAAAFAPMVVSEAETEEEDSEVMAVEDEEVGDLIFKTDEEVMVEAKVVGEVTFRRQTSDSVSTILNGASKLTPIIITTKQWKDMVITMKATMVAAGVVDTVGVVGEDLFEVAMEVVADVAATSRKENREHQQLATEKQPASRGEDTVDTMKGIMLATGMVDTVAGVSEEGVAEVAVAAVSLRKENREHRRLARVKQPSLLKVILLRLLRQRLAEITVAVDSEDGEGTVVVDAALTELKL